MDIPIGTAWVLAPSVRYSRGLSRITDHSGGGGENPDAKNSAFQFGVILRVRL